MRHPGHLPPNLPMPLGLPAAKAVKTAQPTNLRHLPPRPLPKPTNIRALHPRPDDLDYPPLLPATDARQARLDEIGFFVMLGLAYITIGFGLLGLWLSSETDLSLWHILRSLAARWS